MISCISYNCTCRLGHEQGKCLPGSPGSAGLAVVAFVFWLGLLGLVQPVPDSGSSAGLGLLVAAGCTFGCSDLGCLFL